jgi:hypothetical protein
MRQTGRRCSLAPKEPESYSDYLKKKRKRYIDGLKNDISNIKMCSLRDTDKQDLIYDMFRILKMEYNKNNDMKKASEYLQEFYDFILKKEEDKKTSEFDRGYYNGLESAINHIKMWETTNQPYDINN